MNSKKMAEETLEMIASPRAKTLAWQVIACVDSLEQETQKNNRLAAEVERLAAENADLEAKLELRHRQFAEILRETERLTAELDKSRLAVLNTYGVISAMQELVDRASEEESG